MSVPTSHIWPLFPLVPRILYLLQRWLALNLHIFRRFFILIIPAKLNPAIKTSYSVSLVVVGKSSFNAYSIINPLQDYTSSTQFCSWFFIKIEYSIFPFRNFLSIFFAFLISLRPLTFLVGNSAFNHETSQGLSFDCYPRLIVYIKFSKFNWPTWLLFH